MIEWFCALSMAWQLILATLISFPVYYAGVFVLVWITSANTGFAQEELVPCPSLRMWDEPPAA